MAALCACCAASIAFLAAAAACLAAFSGLTCTQWPLQFSPKRYMILFPRPTSVGEVSVGLQRVKLPEEVRSGSHASAVWGLPGTAHQSMGF